MPTSGELGVESVLDVLTNVFHLEGIARGKEFDISCPHPQHIDSRPSCGVNLNNGLWHCLSCGIGGDLVKLGMLVLGESYDSVVDRLEPNTREAAIVTIQKKIAALASIKTRKRKIKLPGPYLEGPLDALVDRGFKPKTLERWGVRFVHEDTLEGNKGTFTIRNSIAIPIRDHSGRLLSWCYRSTPQSPEWQPRYLYTHGISMQEIWFGLQHHHKAPQLVIVEGALDAMWLDQCGIPALALLGSNPSDTKIKKLRQHRSIILFGDKDHAGVKAVRRIGSLLGYEMSVRVARYPRWASGKDPQELAPIDVELAVASAIPWLLWIRNND